MTNLKRKQILISEQQEAKLSALKGQYGLSESELIRKAIDNLDLVAVEEDVDDLLKVLEATLIRAEKAANEAEAEIKKTIKFYKSKKQKASPWGKL